MHMAEAGRRVSDAEILQMVMFCTDLVAHETSLGRPGAQVDLAAAIRVKRAGRSTNPRAPAVTTPAT